MRLSAMLFIGMVSFGSATFAMEQYYARLEDEPWTIETLKEGDQIFYTKKQTAKLELASSKIIQFGKNDRIIIGTQAQSWEVRVHQVIVAVDYKGLTIGQKVNFFDPESGCELRGCCIIACGESTCGTLKGFYHNGDAVILDSDQQLHRLSIDYIQNSACY